MDILVTRRLTLRPPLEVDAEAMAALLNNPNISRMLSKVPQPYTEADAKQWIERRQNSVDDHYFSIYRQTLLGIISSQKRDGVYNIGYWLGEPYWGNGYISEAAKAVISYVFRATGTDSIQSGAYEDNPASLRILEKLGFEPTRTIQDYNETRKCEVACNKVELTRGRFETLFGSLDSEVAA